MIEPNIVSGQTTKYVGFRFPTDLLKKSPTINILLFMKKYKEGARKKFIDFNILYLEFSDFSAANKQHNKQHADAFFR